LDAESVEDRVAGRAGGGGTRTGELVVAQVEGGVGADAQTVRAGAGQIGAEVGIGGEHRATGDHGDGAAAWATVGTSSPARTSTRQVAKDRIRTEPPRSAGRHRCLTVRHQRGISVRTRHLESVETRRLVT